jgi:Ser/Thr protein kinase RdoA (MazF antagonist)
VRQPPAAWAGAAIARAAFAAAAEWLDRPEPERMAGAEPEPVLGTGDGNLSNYLWDGQRVQIIDFEYSGSSDRVFELAEIAEHISARVSGADVSSSLLSHFELTAAETARLRECRRLIAAYWLLTLLRESPGHARNPPGTLELQSHRLLTLLS